MKQDVDIFGIRLTAFTAKEAMKQVMTYMDGETLSIVEMLDLKTLMQEKENGLWKEQISTFDLLLPGEKEILSGTEEYSRGLLRDLDNQTFLKMYLRYLKNNQKRVFVLAENSEGLAALQEMLQTYVRGLHIIGQTVLTEGSGQEAGVINEINGLDPDCVISGLSTPYGERFVSESKTLLNARVWLGGMAMLHKKEENAKGRIGRFFLKKLFHYQVEKQK